MKRKIETICAAWMLLLLLLPARAGAESVVGSPHDLSVSGTGSIRAASVAGACVFCHTSHGGTPQTPLWGHAGSVAKYTTYNSPTMIATVGQPNGASALCLSCHDGTVALGMVNSFKKPIAMQAGVTVLPASDPTNLGTNLSQDHPISFTYNSQLASKQGELADPGSLTGPVKLDQNSQVQCTSCHDAHDDEYGSFLVMDNSASQLCTTCHLQNSWTGSAHNLSTASLRHLNAQAPGPQARAKTAATASHSDPSSIAALITKSRAKTVGANACSNCHVSHKAAGRQQLLLSTQQEQTCFTCHNGTVDPRNIQAQFNKPSVHPVLTGSQLGSSIGGLSRNSMLRGSSQMTCSDCHDSHAATDKEAPAPRASGAIRGIKGITASGAAADPIQFEYELCFRCHGDNPLRTTVTVSRVTPQTDLRLAFSAANQSFHPVEKRGRNPNVPSLLAPYTAATVIKCTDCHNNDQGPGAGGTGPRGPHGSAYAPLLERQLVMNDNENESPQNYAMCYKCHDRGSILSDQSFRAFNSLGQDCGHRFHIVEQKAACTTCHDSHGVALNAHLINFNPLYVTPGSSGQIQYLSTGLDRGTCTLTCHGYDHEHTSYPTLQLTAISALKKTRNLLRPAFGGRLSHVGSASAAAAAGRPLPPGAVRPLF